MKENECIKLIRLKAGLVKTSEAYIEMSTKCSLLFTAQRVRFFFLSYVNLIFDGKGDYFSHKNYI